MQPVKTSWLYFFGRSLCRLAGRLLWGLRVEGADNIPVSGGVLIAPNHRSAIDPPMVGSSMARPLHFMAKQELFEVPVLGFLIKRTNAFPVKRGARDVGAFRNAQRLLEFGEAVLVFPEGTRSKDDSFKPPLPGVGMLSCMAQAPIIPVRVRNSQNPSRKNPLTVIFGKPVYPPAEFNKDSYGALSAAVIEEIKKL
ncbi:MAG TPA: 1-acyl-sn-glycerol-3-phosphate acyltransferase [Elusimicrobia bacterium]|nr:MAG: hypothetical protein A2278_09350 [Elusimicrobia bacterium RIFOXYA12_FULL_49_49]OGS10178.1 MAG: hypothetical protein A2386_01590 [Elusimicrobia bacterium RIFOXYB1_FULL_48_9]OGS14987.1 MAG: hypothetical protein A2251_08205 [Elusimicrobia bacterium RIFOXYA2_FULL_47_53]OGS26078.1 MAG: hypothetical protein A2339_02070 [Elusimicrobia bacterium RIFOXYB12_FULL_50_12]OGS29331.1 MAG: hypothetical protein A2323_04135 [Elusimicrobia bacterium RIFOXYB2_FULL_46_23]HBU70314.1 1-acyl-sn-glycerol-3-pho